MNPIETTISSPSGVTVGSSPTAISAPTPIPSGQPPILENGGQTTASWKGWAKTANWVEIGFLILGTATFLYMLKYYKYRINVERDSLQKLQLKTDELTAEITGLKSAKRQQQQQSRRGGF